MFKKFYIDFEFDGHNGPLISVGVTTTNDAEFYATLPVRPGDLWVMKNVIPVLYESCCDNFVAAESEVELASKLKQFLYKETNYAMLDLHFISDSSVDVWRMAKILNDNGGCYVESPWNLVTYTVMNVNIYPSRLADAVQHNAIWDARALKALIENDVRAY
jgi:hypothetical protein